ncbi:helix-turn-helix domain-containing protein [Thiopseudomonas acetoxidans]|uniref:helix-turn-helix domain-containing protein n=1 Tax=Thiopseudomonas acetoxidans TaxID=3041622 RepID=UPI0033418A31
MQPSLLPSCCYPLGRKPSISAEEIKTLLVAGMKSDEVAKKLGISRSSVYLYKKRIGF